MHRAFLAEQWLAGNTNAADLLRQLRAHGYHGTLPAAPVPALVADHPAHRTGSDTIDNRRIVATQRTAVDQRDHSMDLHPARRPHTTSAGLDAVRARCEHLDRLCGHVRAFARILTTLAGEQLNAWIRAVQDDEGQPQLMSFVRGVLADYDAAPA